jgi:anti-anti-sigma factor
MNRRKLQPNVLFVLLPGEPQLRPELVSLRKKISAGKGAHVVLELSRVEIITSPSIGNLLLLQKLVEETGHKLILCNVRLATKCILRVAGLQPFFELAEDKFEALDILGQTQGVLDHGLRSREQACEESPS